MRVLLDECVPRKLRRELRGHAVRTVGDMGWAGIKNGQLLQRARASFEVFLTVDQNLRFQQALQEMQLAVVVLVSNSNEISALRPLMPQVWALLESEPGAGLNEVVERDQ